MEQTKAKIVMPPDSTYIYAVVRGSLHAKDCSVFGLTVDENSALLERYQGNCDQRMLLSNGIHIEAHVVKIINGLAELGYRVVASCGENETSWTLQREI